MSAVPVAPVETLEAYGVETARCTRCRLAQGRTQVVFGAGNPRADLMFVGEAPGFHEDKQGIPFVGQAVRDGVFHATDIQNDSARMLLDELLTLAGALRTLRTETAGTASNA